MFEQQYGKATESGKECIPKYSKNTNNLITERQFSNRMMIYFFKHHWKSLLWILPIMLFCTYVRNSIPESEIQIFLYFVALLAGFFLIGLYVHRKEAAMKNI